MLFFGVVGNVKPDNVQYKTPVLLTGKFTLKGKYVLLKDYYVMMGFLGTAIVIQE